MGITYVGGQVGGRAGSTSTSNVTFSLSGGTNSKPQPGDLVVIGCTVASQARTPACAISGYTSATQINANGTTYDTSLNMSWKVMGDTADTAFTLPSTGNIADAQRWTVQVWRGFDTTNGFDVTTVSASGTGTGRPNPGSITPTTSGAVVGIIGAGAAATGAAYTAPANYTTGFLTGSTADTNDAMIGSGYRAWTSGAEDPAGYTGGTTNAADSWAAFTYALRPEVSYLPNYISTETIDLPSSATPGAQNITIPANATGVAVHWRVYGASMSSLTSTGTGTFAFLQDGGNEQTGVGYATISATGAQTITPVWSATPVEGPLFFVTYVKDVVDVRSGGAIANETAGSNASITLLTRATDLVLVLDSQFDTGAAIPANASGYTSRATQGRNNEGGRLRTCDAPSDSQTTITGTGTAESGIAGIAIIGSQSTSDVTLGIIGAQVAAQAGTVTASQQVSKALTGVQVAAQAGTVIPSVGISVSLIGEQAVAQSDTLTASQQVSKALTGAQVVAQAGTVTTSQQVSAALTGVQVAAQVGTVSVNAGTNVSLTGAQVAAQSGTLTASQQVSKALTGAQVAAQSGTLTASQQVSKALTGVQVAAQSGTLTASQQVSKALTGVQVVAQSGTLTASQQVSKALTGVQVVAQSGDVSVGADRTIALTGAQVATQTATITAAANLNIALTGVQVVAQAGSVLASNEVIRALFGVQAAAQSGALTASQQVSKALAGAQVAAQVGTLVSNSVLPHVKTVGLVGARAIALAGSINPLTQSQYPPPANVRAGVKYGPTGVEFTGTMGAAGYGRGRVVNE